MTAYLHIGTTNTGNQEKQGFLMQNEEKLLQKAYIYPKSLRVANRHWALVDMVLELVQKEDILKKESVLSHITNERLLRAIENFKSESALHKDKKFIFSAEGQNIILLILLRKIILENIFLTMNGFAKLMLRYLEKKI